MIFWIIFGFLGIIYIPFIILLWTSGTDLKHKLCGIIVMLLFWFLCTGGITLDETNKTNNWNDGCCKCGTHWELRGATKNKIGIETKYYACPNCYAEIKK